MTMSVSASQLFRAHYSQQLERAVRGKHVFVGQVRVSPRPRALASPGGPGGRDTGRRVG